MSQPTNPATQRFLDTLRSILFGLLICFISLTVQANEGGATAGEVGGLGYVEEVKYLREKHQLQVSGWAAPTRPSVFLTNVIVTLGAREVYRGRMEGVHRPDVIANAGPIGWLASGFSIAFNLPRADLAGSHKVNVRIRQGDGTEFDLKPLAGAQSIALPEQPNPGGLVKLCLALAIGVPTGLFLISFATQSFPKVAKAIQPSWFAGAVLISFSLLVVTGTTGSSMLIMLDGSPFLTHDAEKWFGELRYSRADEWQAYTPMAVSQTVHQPPFPVVNKLMGEDGQNMLVVGMTGAPVAHVSALAKPATWGFFVFDLRRALAWYWWFPFFGCFVALWSLLQRIFATDWRVAAVLALAFTAAPYSVGFSGWPAYAAFFPILGIVLIDLLMHSRRLQHGIALSLVLGLTLAGFVLVLYPSWQISLAYLTVPFGLAALWSRRQRLVWGGGQILSLSCALFVCSALLFSWWLDAQEAIATLRETVYPGQRSAETGGDIDRWMLVKGLIAPITMFQPTSMMGEIDAASYVFFVPPIIAALAASWVTKHKVDAIGGTLLGFLILVLGYMFVGFDKHIANWSLWGSATTYRMDLALGLAQTLLLARLFSPFDSAPHRSKFGNVFHVYSVTALNTVVVYLSLSVVPAVIGNQLSPPTVFLVCLFAGIGSYLLMTRRWLIFAALLGCWTLSTSLPFNPIGRAPSTVSSTLKGKLGDSADGSPPRVAVLGAQTLWSQSLIATGVPVANAVLYHPQPSLWNRLDPQHRQSQIHNRYQNLLFVQQAIPDSAGFKIESPRLDAVTLRVDPKNFDFKLLSSSYVLAPIQDRSALLHNGGLGSHRTTNSWVLFVVNDWPLRRTALNDPNHNQNSNLPE
jgi:hypothetical protein